MQYYLLKSKIPTADRPRVARNLEALRAQLAGAIPSKDTEDHLLLATWNLRDFAKTNRRGFGERIPESWFYIAEVLSHFDFVAVQEVNELDEWYTVMDILGGHWNYLATDVTDTSLGGNGERLTFLYDKRKVWFRNIAGEIVLPPSRMITTNVDPKDDDAAAVEGEVAGEKVSRQFARSPYIASFQSNWFKFDICTVHIYYGDESGEKLARRVAEIRQIAEYFGDRAEDALAQDKSLILLGDMNIVDPEHQTMKALTDSGFVVPKALSSEASNISRDKHYDQIVFKTKPGVIEYIDAPAGSAKPHAGVFEIFKHVFTPEQFDDFKDDAAASPNGDDLSADKLKDYYTKEWRTYQFSDHNPMWVQLEVNASGPYLKDLEGG